MPWKRRQASGADRSRGLVFPTLVLRTGAGIGIVASTLGRATRESATVQFQASEVLRSQRRVHIAGAA